MVGAGDCINRAPRLIYAGQWHMRCFVGSGLHGAFAAEQRLLLERVGNGQLDNRADDPYVASDTMKANDQPVTDGLLTGCANR